jgi:uncharacterized protein YutE (UPF0331/DUF86 family)
LPVDPQLVGARLAALEEYLGILDQLARLELEPFVADPRNYGSAERFLQLAIEAVFDIGTHCIAALGLRRPERYADVLPTLAEASVISRRTAQELWSLAGFRNLLVHDYTRIDRARVHQFLRSRLDGLRGFAADLSVYLSAP